MRPLFPATLLLMLLARSSSAQVQDFTMEAFSTGAGFPGTPFSSGFGPRNYIPNGSFNRYESLQGGCQNQSWGGYWNSGLGRWDGFSWNSSTPFSMIAPGTYWPYSLSYYCDFDDSNFSHPAAQQNFYGGFLEVPVSRLTGGNRAYSYILVTLKKPLTPGVEYAFHMELAKAWATNQANAPAFDRFGAALLHELPDTLVTGGPLFDIEPFAETPAGDPVGPSDVVTLADTIIGAGEKYLVVGIFRPDDELTFEPVTPNPAGWTSTYWFDNFKLYRAFCPGATGGFTDDPFTTCVGDTLDLIPQFSTAPLQWTVDGADEGSGASIELVTPPVDSLNIRLVCDTGACLDTAYTRLWAHRLEIALADTFLFCADPLLLEPQVVFIDVLPSHVDAFWNSMDGSFSVETSPEIAVTVVDSGTYVLRTEFDDCVQSDTVRVDPAPSLLTDDGQPLLLPEVRPEHCINMNDGGIIVHDQGYPGVLSFDWYDPPLQATDSLSGLGEGLFRARIWDDGLRCAFWDIDVPLMLDSCARIDGAVRLSPDQSCLTMANDSAMALETVLAMPSGNAAVTDTLGEYLLFVPPGPSFLEHQPMDPWAGNRCGSGTSVSLVNAGATATVDLVDTVHFPVHDLEVQQVFSYPAWVIANSTHLYVHVRNPGEFTDQALLRVHLSPAFTVQTSGDPEFVGVVGDTLLFDLGTLAPQEQRAKVLIVDVPGETDLIGTAVHVDVRVSTVPGEDLVVNNTWNGDFAVLGAYDPNDKQVSPKGAPVSDLTPVTERRFTYTVRFQNTGNYPAARVLITDTLPALLDPLSLAVTHASHNVQAFIYEGVLYLDHPGILLPDSTSDPEGSQGQVVFSLGARSQATIGDEILNTAYIYFDQNPPIVTNTVRNVYGDITLAVPMTSGATGLRVWPDAGGFAYALNGSSAGSGLLRVLDVRGALVRALPWLPAGHFSTEGWAPGIYALEAGAVTGRSITRFVVAP